MKTPILKKAPLYLVLAVVAGVMLLGINAAFGVVGDPFGIGVAPTFSGLTVLGEGNFNSELTVDGAISTQKTVSAVAIDSTDPAAMDTNNSAVYGYGGDGENMMGTGVFGRAIKGVGVQGVSDENIGGYFYSESSPYALYADNDNDTQYGWGIEGTSYNGIKGLASGAT
ncbi:hypothetical protein KJ632_00275, partial [Patescibacteria group bacterium]|nr:hypothetical protein [Patescibacteria group bacterium]